MFPLNSSTSGKCLVLGARFLSWATTAGSGKIHVPPRPFRGLEAVMRLSLIAALAACLFTAPAWARPTSPSPGAQSPDPDVSSMDLLGYIRSLEAQIVALEARLKSMPKGGLSKAQLETTLAALKAELTEDIALKADQAKLDELAARLATVDAALNGGVTVWYLDGDGDGFGASGGALKAALDQPLGYVIVGGDCADGNAGVNPDATEVVGDGFDNDCDANTSDVPPAQPGRRIYGTVSLTGLAALHPGTYPADTIRNPDHGGAMVEIGFRVPLASGEGGYLNVCTSGGAGYASGHTVPWRVALGLCGGWRLHGADVGFSAEVGAIGSITDANATRQTGDYVGVVGGGFLEVSPTKIPAVFRAGFLAGGGNVRLATKVSGDVSGFAPVFVPMGGVVFTY